MGIYVLIIVIALGHGTSATSIDQEFSSLEVCEAARVNIVSSATYSTQVVTSGCYKR